MISALLLVIPRFFPPVKGAYRWIRLPAGISVQPSELAKITIILFLANYCALRQSSLNDWKNRAIVFSALFLMAGLVLFGKDLGTTVLICAVAWIIFFVAGMNLRVILGIPAVLIPIGLCYIRFFDEERWSRITSFSTPESSPEGGGYQLLNSLMALGSGHWTGLGFSESKMKAYYLPEAHTDFILSIVGEELGFICLSIVIILYITLFLCSIYIAFRSKHRQGLLLAVGLGSLLALQAIINIGVISGFFPTKGMPAPFISYGGSNILMAWTAVGLILSVAGSNENIHHQPDDSINFKTNDAHFE